MRHGKYLKDKMTTANNISVVSSDKVFSGDVAVSYTLNGVNTSNANNSYIKLNDEYNIGYVPSEATGLLGGNFKFYPYWPGYDYYCQWQQPFTWANVYVDYSWRVDTSKNDRIALSLDVPGVALGDIDVSIDAYVIRVTGKRHDTGASVSHSYTLPQCYDTKSIAAKLDCGVLTLTVKKLAEMKTRKITVKGA